MFSSEPPVFLGSFCVAVCVTHREEEFELLSIMCPRLAVSFLLLIQARFVVRGEVKGGFGGTQSLSWLID